MKKSINFVSLIFWRNIILTDDIFHTSKMMFLSLNSDFTTIEKLLGKAMGTQFSFIGQANQWRKKEKYNNFVSLIFWINIILTDDVFHTSKMRFSSLISEFATLENVPAKAMETQFFLFIGQANQWRKNENYTNFVSLIF